MYFGEICLRVHFLMAGSFLVNNKKLDHDGGKAAETPSFEMDFSKDKLVFHKSAVDIRSSMSCRERYDDLNEVDICSPVFNQRRAVTLVMSQRGRQLCDVLLDQTILPGVGNIIKNEALFDSGVKPDSKVEELSEEHVSHLVKMTRDFSMVFLKCRREGTNLGKFLKIYNKGKCTQCQGKIVRCRQGDDSARMTYFCGNCQDNNLVLKKQRTLPKKNSLLGWVQTGDSSVHDDIEQPSDTPVNNDLQWTCGVCTLINGSRRLACEACLTTKPCEPKTEPSGICNSSLNSPTALSDMKNPGTDSFNHRTQSKSGPSAIHRVQSKSGTIAADNKLEPPLKRRRVEEGNISTKDNSKVPCCPGHNKKCSLREVFKKGDNYGRWFFSCSIRGQQQCKYFQWADELFPFCEAHNKRCTLRTVLKQGPNNGRQFFVCAVSKKNSKVKCETFHWAVGFDTK